MGKTYVTVDKRSKKDKKAYYTARREEWEGVKPYSQLFADHAKFNKAQRSRDKAELKKY